MEDGPRDGEDHGRPRHQDHRDHRPGPGPHRSLRVGQHRDRAQADGRRGARNSVRGAGHLGGGRPSRARLPDARADRAHRRGVRRPHPRGQLARPRAQPVDRRGQRPEGRRAQRRADCRAVGGRQPRARSMSIPILVQKFGGTSVSTPERRQQVVGHVRRAIADGNRVAIVVSAMGRRGDPYATDTLLDLLRSDGGPVEPDDYDLMFTCGEAISAAVMSQALKRAGIPAVGLTAAQARIYTDGQHVEASIEEIDTSRLHALMAAGQVPVVTGGQGVARDTLDYTTLGRGGSDTSGVALGVALGACRVDIFTDVEGIAVVDPRLVPGARMLTRVSYAAMHELARFGAKVVHPRALMTGWAGRTPVVIRSTFSDAPGTMIGEVEDEAPIVGLALLPAMETVVLPAGAVNTATREAWERR